MKDEYLYEGTETLKNKLNIRDPEKLKKAEAEICFLNLIDVDTVEKGNIDASYIRDIHRHIFGEIYDWAGEYRTVPIVKEEIVIPGLSLDYSRVNRIDKELELRLKDLKETDWDSLDINQKSLVFARKLALLWRVHPFRDGNTRTTLSFAYAFAKEYGFPFDITTFTEGLLRQYDENNRVKKYSVRDKFVLASLDTEFYPEVEHLATLFREAMIRYQKTQEEQFSLK